MLLVYVVVLLPQYTWLTHVITLRPFETDFWVWVLGGKKSVSKCSGVGNMESSLAPCRYHATTMMQVQSCDAHGLITPLQSCIQVSV